MVNFVNTAGHGWGIFSYLDVLNWNDCNTDISLYIRWNAKHRFMFAKNKKLV